MNKCRHGLSLAAICVDCNEEAPTPQQLLGELMDAAGVYNDGSTPAVLWGRCIARVKKMRDPLGAERFSWYRR